MLRCLPPVIFCLALLSGRAEPVIPKNELGLSVDRRLIDRVDNLQQVLGQPQPKEVVVVFDQPWEKAANYVTVIEDDLSYRMYYRGATLTPKGEFDESAQSRRSFLCAAALGATALSLWPAIAYPP